MKMDNHNSTGRAIMKVPVNIVVKKANETLRQARKTIGSVMSSWYLLKAIHELLA